MLSGSGYRLPSLPSGERPASRPDAPWRIARPEIATMKKKTLIPVLIVLTLIALHGESLLSLDMSLMQSVGYSKTTEAWLYAGAGSADLQIKSTGSRDVKGELALSYIPVDGLPSGYTLVNLKKASIKVQFPSLRLTMGKTRIGWGDGTVFNAGDVLYGSLSPSVDLTADEIRSETALLTLVRYSAGRNYAEAIVMAPSPDLSVPVAPVMPGITATSAGGRFVLETGPVTLEGGYLCKGQAKAAGDVTGHRPYLSLHGYGWADWYGSASLAIPFEGAEWDTGVKDTVHFTAGAFRQFGLGYDGTLSVRLEALAFPWGTWEEQSGTGSYGLYLYPEATAEIGRNLTLPLMALISPVDASARLTAGFNWSVVPGIQLPGIRRGRIGRRR